MPAALRLLCGVVVPAAVLCAEPLPRVTFPSGDPRRTLTHFSQDNVSHYDVFLLDESKEELYVGARDRVLALAVGTPGSIRAKASITWGPTAEKTSECAFKKKSQETECFNFIRVLVALNQTHLYVCGTYAFSPACTYIHLENFTLMSSGRGQPFLDGKGQCPFDPQHTYTALLVDGELYAGTMNNFQGNEPIISRSLGTRTLLKTDAFLRWLSADAAFVASFSIPGDDKVYFFFEETADEFDFFERLLVPRVARVCKSDVGGDKVLQKKWTTFLKAQLVCSQAGRFPFNVIHHTFALPRHDGRADFYAVFTSQWQAGRAGSAAVCAYSQEDLEKVFEGKYKELNKESSRWTVYSGADMTPRPGSCAMGPSSDKALSFMKEHFLMDGKVSPIQGRPLLVKSDVTYTRITVDETRGISGVTYRVMFLATAEGFLHKAVELPKGPHIVESIQLFAMPEPVKNLLLAPGKGILYVGYSRGVLQVPLANCSLHQSCAECVLARDPYCAWHSSEGSCQPARLATEDTSAWLQDVETGSSVTTCHHRRSAGMPRAWGAPEDPTVQELSPQLNTVVHLPCPRNSALATYSWQQPSSGQGNMVLLPDHTLVVIMQEDTAGTYKCQATENGYTWTVAHYQLRDPDEAASGDGLDEEELAGGPSGPGTPRSYWPQFVAVTVLLAGTLTVAACLALLAYRDQLKARSKVRGCSTAHSPPSRHREKVPLNGGSAEPPAPGAATEEEEEDEGSQACCLQLDGDIDVDNNRLHVPAGDTV
ncbi:semaphorin-4A-like [Corvus kubaryi]|uniref:semaphorin-4A-like n=1 Tax=Corvus kubaryi TaxID=68294 RepID=UPI001C048F8A|nr:semaphorin-4A-like [Corvus kubaryi]XP_041901037.1 semaphorin-4A-like [Corvus kubaryi]XP_041901039.1 semaphorin-4A-like [Corvus kubaryi]XP_041901040.1 semaphorin-4A-like [Corvus kubaryi]